MLYVHVLSVVAAKWTMSRMVAAVHGDPVGSADSALGTRSGR